jgi:hypothetical protein
MPTSGGPEVKLLRQTLRLPDVWWMKRIKAAVQCWQRAAAKASDEKSRQKPRPAQPD